MANLRVVAAVRNAMLDAIKTAIDAGSGPGTIKFYSGTQPANADASLSGNTLLGTLTCSDPSASAASGGTLTFSTVTRDNAADATGTASFVRVQDSNGSVVLDADVGTSGATVIVPSTSFTAGEPVEISSFTITIPA